MSQDDDDGDNFPPFRMSEDLLNLESRMKLVSSTMKSTASERKLASDTDDDDELGSHARLAIQIDVIAGACSETKLCVGSEQDAIMIGRAPSNMLVCHDAEVSGRHATLQWSYPRGCWTIFDEGSLNGTFLNGEKISREHKVKGDLYRLSADDMIQLGSMTRLKVSLMPEEMAAAESSDRRHSLSAESFPKSLTIFKNRVPSFHSLVSPKLDASPSSNAVCVAVSEELRFECCIVSCTGRDHARKSQEIEDVTTVQSPFMNTDSMYASLFCVFDGHCGRTAAEAASSALPEEIAMRVQETVDREKINPESYSTKEFKTPLHDAFLAADDRIADEAGCTATSILIWKLHDDHVYIQGANVGDSMAILISLPETGDEKTIHNLTEDHRLSNPRERERLERNGIPIGEETRRLYGLNLARALGDRFLKDEDLGLSAEPSISPAHEIDANHGAILIIASDGVWDVLSIDQVGAIAIKVDEDSHGTVSEIAAAIVREAQSLGSRDDITTLIVRMWSRNSWETTRQVSFI